MHVAATTAAKTPAPPGPKSKALPEPVIWSLRQYKTGTVLLSIPCIPGYPGLSLPAVRHAAAIQARRHAALGEQVLVLAGEQELFLYDRRGCRVHCAGCGKWTAPARAGRTSYCARCRRVRAERARKRKAARLEAARRQLQLELGTGDG